MTHILTRDFVFQNILGSKIQLQVAVQKLMVK